MRLYFGTSLPETNCDASQSLALSAEKGGGETMNPAADTTVEFELTSRATSAAATEPVLTTLLQFSGT